MEINFIVDTEVDASITEDWLLDITRDIAKHLEIAVSAEMGLVITDNSKIKELNRVYRDIDEPTDVLAFAMEYEAEKGEIPFVVPPDDVEHLGEVIISYPQAVKQALERSHGIKLELATLVVHGMLHLLGYDHEKPGEKRVMQAKEREIIEILNID